MLSKSEIIEQLQKGFEVQLKPFLLEAYRIICNKEISNPNCSSCFHDAYYEMLYYLKRDGSMQPAAKNYICLHLNIHMRGKLSHQMTDEDIELYFKEDERNAKMYFRKVEKKPKQQKVKEDANNETTDTEDNTGHSE